jgi:hypothetical protein
MAQRVAVRLALTSSMREREKGGREGWYRETGLAGDMPIRGGGRGGAWLLLLLHQRDLHRVRISERPWCDLSRFVVIGSDHPGVRVLDIAIAHEEPGLVPGGGPRLVVEPEQLLTREVPNLLPGAVELLSAM